tara:strand:+ start:236 stop:820 length:585 start_codon:yes stop_codon:yes gene_type:complete
MRAFINVLLILFYFSCSSEPKVVNLPGYFCPERHWWPIAIPEEPRCLNFFRPKNCIKDFNEYTHLLKGWLQCKKKFLKLNVKSKKEEVVNSLDKALYHYRLKGFYWTQSIDYEKWPPLQEIDYCNNTLVHPLDECLLELPQIPSCVYNFKSTEYKCAHSVLLWERKLDEWLDKMLIKSINLTREKIDHAKRKLE